MAVADMPTNMLVAREIAGQLAEVGIQVDVRPTDPDLFYGQEIGVPRNVRAKGYGLVLTSWTADFATPASFLVPLVDSRSTKEQPNTNYAWLRDEELDGTID